MFPIETTDMFDGTDVKVVVCSLVNFILHVDNLVFWIVYQLFLDQLSSGRKLSAHSVLYLAMVLYVRSHFTSRHEVGKKTKQNKQKLETKTRHHVNF